MDAKIADVLFTQYGPIAFGLVSLIVIWQVIVKPELARRDVEREAWQLMASAFTKIASTLESLVDRMERALDREEAR